MKPPAWLGLLVALWALPAMRVTAEVKRTVAPGREAPQEAPAE